MEFSTREIATLIILIGFISLVLVYSSNRRDIARSFLSVINALLHRKIIFTVLFYLVYVAAVVLLAQVFNVWSWDLLKDTLIIVIFMGFPMIVKVVKMKDAQELISHVWRSVFSLSAILVIYVNLAPFPLWGEVLMQIIALFLVLIEAVSKRMEGGGTITKIAQCLLGIIGLSLFAKTTIQLIDRFDDFDWLAQVRAYAMSIWLPIMLVPFMYSFAYIAACEGTFVRLGFFSKDRKPLFRVYIAVGLGFLGRLHYASRFCGIWLPEVARERTFAAAWRTMKRYRCTVKEKARAMLERKVRLEKYAGLTGRGENGLWLDRREFYETKDELMHLYFCQMGWYRNQGGRYQSELGLLISPVANKRLSDDYPIEWKVQSDGQAWAAWRKTPGGYYFGMGGVRDVNLQWQYDGENPPEDMPCNGSTVWREATLGEQSREWSEDDAPPSEV